MVNRSAASLNAVFHALSDPTRRQIMRRLAGSEKTVGEVAKPYRMSLAAVSKHLNVLEKADLIARERRGKFQIVRLNARSLEPAEAWIGECTRFWNQQLDNLETYLEGEKR